MTSSGYVRSIWDARYFWLHLARAELKYRFRRSKLGLLWTIINPLVLTAMMALVFGNIFGIPMRSFAPYVFSGLLVWDYLIGSVVVGCDALLVSEQYIKQFKHPLAIYSLKTTLVNLASFLIALLGLILWILVVSPANLLISIPALPVCAFFLFVLGWPIALITSFIKLKYRDFGLVMGLVMQLIWYMSPVFLQPAMFRAAHLSFLIDYNPVAHILNLVRAPLLYGQFPTLVDFGFTAGTAVVLSLAAIYKIRSSEKTMIYYF